VRNFFLGAIAVVIAATFNEGIKIYGGSCIVCHGAADGRPSTVGFGLYQRVPLLGRHGVEDDPVGQTYWKVRTGFALPGCRRSPIP